MASPERELHLTEDALQQPFEFGPPSGQLVWEIPSFDEYRDHRMHFLQFGMHWHPELVLTSTEEPGSFRTRHDQFLATQLALARRPYSRGSIPPTYETVDLHNPEVFPVRMLSLPQAPEHAGDFRKKLYFYRLGLETPRNTFRSKLVEILDRTNRILYLRGVEPFPVLPR